MRPAEATVEEGGIAVLRTPARHGRGEIGEAMAPASGFVVRAPGEPVLYVAGDSIWCDEVAAVLDEHSPEAVVVNAGAAQFLEGGPITMTASDVLAVVEHAPGARVIAVHMEAINHCLETRDDLRAAVGDSVLVPADGEWLEV